MASEDKKPSTSPGAGDGRIRTLADLIAQTDSDYDGDCDSDYDGHYGDYDSDFDNPQVFIGKRSGMLVQGPPKGDAVNDIFNQVRQLGAVEGPLRPSSSSTRFTGTGRLLSGESVAAAPQEPEIVVHNIVFWRNGFTVNDGSLRSMDDPANESFLESIRNTDCPKELKPANRATPVLVNLIRRDENFPVSAHNSPASFITFQ
ncbi:Plant UBX domain-containing protein [Drosera capensis]